MAIKRVNIKNFLVFNGIFSAEFCPGINLFIGSNGTGKTTLLKALYDLKNVYMVMDAKTEKLLYNKESGMLLSENPIGERSRNWGNAYVDAEIKNCIYIPEKDILEHAKGLLPFIEQKTTGFSSIYKDLLIAAQDIPTQEQSVMQKSVGEKISLAICGHVEWVHGEGTFYMIKNDGKRIPFSDEASGFKKLGFLGLLITSGQLEPNTVLFWDEPENSLNPELIPILVDILLELSRNSVQIFISTHSEILASYFAVNRQAGDSVMFTALYKDGEQIKATTSDRFDLLEPNNLTAEPIKLYEKEIVKGLNGNG